MEAAFFVHTLVGVGAEVIPLGLQHIGIAVGGTVRVEVRQGAAQRHYGHTPFRGQRYYTTPAGPGFFQCFRKEVAEQQVLHTGLLRKAFADVIQEPGPDDAAIPPDFGNLIHLQVPAIGLAGGPQQVESLGVSADFCRIQCVAQIFQQLRFFFRRKGFFPAAGSGFQHFRQFRVHLFQRSPLFFIGAHVPGKHRFRNGRRGHTQFQGAHAGPTAGAFLFRHVQNHIHHSLAGLRIFFL